MGRRRRGEAGCRRSGGGYGGVFLFGGIGSWLWLGGGVRRDWVRSPGFWHRRGRIVAFSATGLSGMLMGRGLGAFSIS